MTVEQQMGRDSIATQQDESNRDPRRSDIQDAAVVEAAYILEAVRR